MFSPVKKNPVGLFKEKKKEYIVQFTFKIFLLAIEFYLYPFFNDNLIYSFHDRIPFHRNIGHV